MRDLLLPFSPCSCVTQVRAFIPPSSSSLRVVGQVKVGKSGWEVTGLACTGGDGQIPISDSTFVSNFKLYLYTVFSPLTENHYNTRALSINFLPFLRRLEKTKKHKWKGRASNYVLNKYRSKTQPNTPRRGTPFFCLLFCYSSPPLDSLLFFMTISVPLFFFPWP